MCGQNTRHVTCLYNAMYHMYVCVSIYNGDVIFRFTKVLNACIVLVFSAKHALIVQHGV